MKVVLCCLLLAMLFQSSDDNAKPFRIIPILTREHGYNNFESIVFMSQQDLDAFLTDTSTQIGWNNRQRFEEDLRNAKVDFGKEALVLLRHTEGSGSVQVTFETPVLRGRTLLCEIRGRPIPPGYAGTADMAYYCFAVAVSKAHVTHVELRGIEGGFSERRLAPIVLPIDEKIPACPSISVSCPDDHGIGNKPVKFKASVAGGRPTSEISYNWSVSKGTIKQGQGTAEIEVDITDVGLSGLTGTVEVSGFPPNCSRTASCTTAIPD